MKKSKRMLRKLLLLTSSALLLVSLTVGVTLAYLTDTESVTNTFTVGNVGISLDEAPVDANGKKTTGDRVQENKYHLIPGASYDKDPTIHVDANSESGWLFVKIENGIAPIETKTQADTIAAQMTANGWVALGDDAKYANIYTRQKATEKKAEVQDFEVFEKFVIDGSVTKEELADYATDNGAINPVCVTVTAYMVQAAGFENAAAAWDATFGLNTGTSIR